MQQEPLGHLKASGLFLELKSDFIKCLIVICRSAGENTCYWYCIILPDPAAS